MVKAEMGHDGVLSNLARWFEKTPFGRIVRGGRRSVKAAEQAQEGNSEVPQHLDPPTILARLFCGDGHSSRSRGFSSDTSNRSAVRRGRVRRLLLSQIQSAIPASAVRRSARLISVRADIYRSTRSSRHVIDSLLPRVMVPRKLSRPSSSWKRDLRRRRRPVCLALVFLGRALLVPASSMIRGAGGAHIIEGLTGQTAQRRRQVIVAGFFNHNGGPHQIDTRMWHARTIPAQVRASALSAGFRHRHEFEADFNPRYPIFPLAAICATDPHHGMDFGEKSVCTSARLDIMAVWTSSYSANTNELLWRKCSAGDSHLGGGAQAWKGGGKGEVDLVVGRRV